MNDENKKRKPEDFNDQRFQPKLRKFFNFPSVDEQKSDDKIEQVATLEIESSLFEDGQRPLLNDESTEDTISITSIEEDEETASHISVDLEDEWNNLNIIKDDKNVYEAKKEIFLNKLNSFLQDEVEKKIKAVRLFFRKRDDIKEVYFTRYAEPFMLEVPSIVSESSISSSNLKSRYHTFYHSASGESLSPTSSQSHLSSPSASAMGCSKK